MEFVPVLAQINPTQVDMLERLAALPLQALLLLLVIVLGFVIYKLWQRILVLEARIEQLLSGFRDPNQTP